MINRRTIVVIWVMAVLTLSLIVLRPSGSVGIRSAPERRLSSGNPSLVTSNGSVTTAHSTQPANAGSSQASKIAVPDYVVYGQLFRAVVLIKQQTKTDEGTGKSGAVSATQSLLNLSEAEAIELEQTALTWDQEEEPIIREAEEVMTRYREGRSAAIVEGKEPPAAPYEELEELQAKLNGAILGARDGLRERLGENAFDHLQESVAEHITANIKVAPLNEKSSGQNSESDRPTLRMPRDQTSLQTLSSNHPRGTESSATKSAGKGDSTQDARIASAQEPQPNFNWCFFGGIVFYGTFLWLAPQVDLVFQLSFTQLDICAGLVYDPYVYGALYVGNNYVLWDERDSLGRSFFRPAIVLNRAFAFANTLYSAYGEHWIARCGLLRPDSVQPACDWYYVDYTWVQGVTPQCVSGGAPLGVGPNFATCPGPSPTPTPTPTVLIDSVGFTGDYMIRHWDKDAADRKLFDNPDGDEPAWIRAAPDKKFPAAYKRGTNPMMFATFKLTPAPNTSRPVQIRVKKGTTVIATKSDNIGGGQAKVENIEVTFSSLESAALVKRGEYEFTWEVSFDGGTNWANAGKSGKHTIYWTWDAPLSRPFKNRSNTECFLVPGQTPGELVLDCDALYDEALKHSAGETGSGSADLATVIKRINEGVDGDITYVPSLLDPTDHPLAILNSPFNRRAQCSGTANFFRGLLRSIGVDATTHYWAGGNPQTGTAQLYNYITSTNKVSFRVQRPASNEGMGGTDADVEPNPHFSFHATVEAGGAFYDPSYGLSAGQAEVQLLEASKFPDPGFTDGTTESNPHKIESLNFITNNNDTSTTCPHGQNRGTLSPNPIDEVQFFVNQQYVDFLNRDPDPDGLAFWVSQITNCNGNPTCIDEHRRNVSVAFSVCPEFHDRGYFLERLYKAAYARYPLFQEEYLPGYGALSYGTLDDHETNKQMFMDDFVASEEFQAAYPFTMEHADYVDALFANAGFSDPGERAALISGLDNDTETRATVLRRVVDNQTFFNSEFNRGYIQSCYYVYLRREPDPEGYQFWLSILNSENDIYHITQAFLVCTEYRTRFGQP